MLSQAGAKNRADRIAKELAERAAVKIQSIWRGKVARRRYLQQKAAAALYRSGLAAAAREKDEEKLQLYAARALQAAFRGRQARAEVQQRKTAIKLIQAGMRGRIARKHNNLGAARNAAIKIQANWRVKMARREFLKSKTSAVLIQSSFRGAKARGEFAMQVILLTQRDRAWLRGVDCIVCGVLWCTEGGSVDVSIRVEAACCCEELQTSQTVRDSNPGTCFWCKGVRILVLHVLCLSISRECVESLHERSTKALAVLPFDCKP
jgi:hypothetical protein